MSGTPLYAAAGITFPRRASQIALRISTFTAQGVEPTRRLATIRAKFARAFAGRATFFTILGI